MKSTLDRNDIIYPAGLALLALLVFIYVFNPKIDINGDNCYYYAFATGLAEGRGYVDFTGNPSALFPPGYPLLMTPLRLVTESVVAQKILNLVFLFAATVLLYFILRRENVKPAVAFTACAGVLVNAHILEFSTMMMSEASCILFMVLALWAFLRAWDSASTMWRSPWIYLFLFATVYAFFIRTQAVVLFGAFLIALLMKRKFKLSALLSLVFFAGYAPWGVRNMLLGLGQSRYVSQIDFSNVFGNLRMLLVQAIPEGCLPFFNVNYGAAPQPLLYLIAIIMIALVIYGFWQMKRLRMMLLFLFVGNIAIVSIMNTPSYYRYMVTVLPFITAGVVVGLWSTCDRLCHKFLKRSFSPWFLLLLFLPLPFNKNDEGKHTLFGLNKLSVMDYPITVKHFLALGGQIPVRYPDAGIVASRKPELLFVHSGVQGIRYKEGRRNIDILNDLIDDNVDYIILENLGFQYAYEVLYPFLQYHSNFFTPVLSTGEPVNILFKFDRDAATRWLEEHGYKR